MPELPEVETVMRGVAPALCGERIERARAFRADLRWRLPENFADRLTGRRVVELARRSKYILAALDDGWTWLIHLGMTGRFAVGALDGERREPGAFARDPGERGAHDHLVLETRAHRLIYNDVRRFGAMDLAPTAEIGAHKLLSGLGPEPLTSDFNAAYLGRRLQGRAITLKTALLDQKIVAGLGNIYVCEALWRARLSPRTMAATVKKGGLSALVRAVKAVLKEAIASGGSSLRDYRQADGELGYFQHRFAVYGREGEPCARERCRGVVRRIVQSGRSSFFCPNCQR